MIFTLTPVVFPLKPVISHLNQWFSHLNLWLSLLHLWLFLLNQLFVPLKPLIFPLKPVISPLNQRFSALNRWFFHPKCRSGSRHGDEQDQRSKGPGPRYPPVVTRYGKSPSLVWFTGKFTGNPHDLHGKNHGKNNLPTKPIQWYLFSTV